MTTEKAMLRIVGRSLPDGLDALVAESLSENYRSTARLREDWHSGRNRFDRTGELLLSAIVDDELVGIGGINVDPWAGAEHVGRLRRLYVVARCRRLGVGSLLVKHLLREGSGAFELVRLSVADDRGRQFYESIGFTSVDDPHASHGVRLKHRG